MRRPASSSELRPVQAGLFVPGVVSPTFDYTDSYTVVNANLAAAFRNYTVGVYVENLFDDRSVTYVHPEAFLDSRYALVRPRTVGVRVGYRF